MAKLSVNSCLTLKFLLVGDSDVGKQEFLQEIPGSSECHQDGPTTTTILLDGKPVTLHLWDTSGQGRFSTVLRNQARGAHGLLVMYDITNKWSFNGVKRWLKEVDEHTPGLPKVLIGNRLHLEFNRTVHSREAFTFAKKHKMEHYEVSALAGFNVPESLTQLSRLVIQRMGLHSTQKINKVMSLQDLCCRIIIRNVKSVHILDRLPIPINLQNQVRSFAEGSHLATTTIIGKRPSRRSSLGNLTKVITTTRRRVNSLNFECSIM